MKSQTTISFFLSLLLLVATATTAGAIPVDDEDDDEDASTGITLIAQDDEDDDFLTIGGALRVNAVQELYEGDTTTENGYITIDTWRLNIEGRTVGIPFNFEYRFYPTFDTHFIHTGWIGWDFSEATQLQLGVSQAPFGNIPFASNSWWFQNGYYMGLEDNRQMGAQLITEIGGIDTRAAFYRQPAPSGPSSDATSFEGASFGVGGDGRYSYNVIPVAADDRLGIAPDGNQSLRELNTSYLRLAAPIGSTSEIGVSGRLGQLYNQVRAETDYTTALSGHASLDVGNFNLMPQVTYFNFEATNDDGSTAQTVPMGAYASGAYPVAAEATKYQISLSYSWDVDLGPVSNITFYNDYAYLDKANDAFNDTQQNIFGFLLTKGKIFTYVDIASGKNQPWLTDNFGTGLGEGVADPDWNTRLNINVGYYF